jgi:hypothetical protein
MVNVRAATTRIRPATSAPMIGRAAKQAARSFLAVMSGDENNYGVVANSLRSYDEIITPFARLTRGKLDDEAPGWSCSGIVTPRPAPERAEAAAEMFVAYKIRDVFYYCFSFSRMAFPIWRTHFSCSARRFLLVALRRRGRPARSILARSIWIVDVSFSWRQRAGFCEYPTPPRNHPLVALIFLWRLPLVDGYH